MKESEQAPSPLELVWARHGRPSEETRTGLTADRIVAAAIELADTAGLAAVSMSRVATGLGFTTMSLYRHVQSKDELILLMQDTAVGPPPAELDVTEFDVTVPDGTDGGWRPRLERWTWAVLHAMRAHPWVLQTIPMFGPPATPNQLAWLERALRALGDTGLTEPEKLMTTLLLDAHVLSDLQFAAVGERLPPGEGGVDGYRDTLSRMLDPEQYPAVLRAVAGGALDPADDPITDRDTDFAFGLDRILDGVASLISSRANR